MWQSQVTGTLKGRICDIRDLRRTEGKVERMSKVKSRAGNVGEISKILKISNHLKASQNANPIKVRGGWVTAVLHGVSM